MTNHAITLVIEHRIIHEHRYRLSIASCMPLLHLIIMLMGNNS